jgi:pimeloyl-ACP methyl ester carboxylesterase
MSLLAARIALVGLAAVAAVTALAYGSSARGADEGPRLVGARQCPHEKGYVCSTLRVPLDYSGRRSGTLDLAVAAGTNRAAPRGVLVMLTGGPGQPGMPFAGKTTLRLGPAAREYRVVLLDQRGTGGSALRCPALQREMGFSDIAAPSAAAVRACARMIGPSRSFYGTDDVVADLDRLRHALGVTRLTLVGVSYGTYVAERYALAHPDHVARLVLDSVVPHTGRGELETLALPEVARVLRLVCRETGCAADPAADLAGVVARYGNGVQLLDAIVVLSVVDPTFRHTFDVPRLLHEARLGRPADLNAMLATIRGWEGAESAGGLSQGLHASALCGDWRFPWGGASAPVEGRAAALRRYGASLPRSAVWPFDRATATGNGIMRQCLYWPPTIPTSAPRSGARLPAVPTLLIVGDRDLSTPIPWARRELALAPRGRLVIVKGSGHSVQSRASVTAGRTAVRRFLLAS